MQPTRSIALALLLSLAACTSTDSSGLKSEDRLKLHREFAMKFFSSGDYAQAEHQANLGLALDKRDAELRLIMGWVSIKRAKSEDVLVAETIFRDVAKGGDYRALIGLGEALERKGVLYWNAADAVASGQRETPASDPRKRADELRRDARKFWKESTVSYESALKAKPSNVQAINGLQRVAALQNDYEVGLRWSLELLAISRGELDFWREDLKRPNLSPGQEAELRRLMAGGEKLVVETHLQASGLLVSLGRKEQAIEHLDAAAQLAPERAEIYSRRAQVRHGLGQHDAARADLELFLKRSKLALDHPDVQRALDLLAECQVALSKPTS